YPAAHREHASRLEQHGPRVRHVLEEPHHPDVVEGLVVERQRSGVSLHERRLDTRSLEVFRRRLELTALDVDAGEPQAPVLLAENGEDGTDSAADLEQPRARRKFGAV